MQRSYRPSSDVFVAPTFIRRKKQLLLNGDVVISSANSMELVGKNILWNKDENDVSFGGFLTIVRTSNGLVLHPEFLSLIYQYLFETGYFANIATQTTNIANLTNKKLNEIPFPIPPLAEQHRIVAKLEESFAEIDRAEEAYRELQTLTDVLRKKILQEAVMGKLVPQLDGEPAVEQIGEKSEDVPFSIPEKWKWYRLNQAGNFISGYTPAKNLLSNNGDIPYFKVSDMNTPGNEVHLRITSAYIKSNSSNRFTPANTIVYPKNGGAIFTNKRRIVDNNSVVDTNTGGFVPGPLLTTEYSYLFFKIIDFRKLSKGTTLPTIDQAKLKNYLIPIPPIDEQWRIVSKVEELMKNVDRLVEMN